MSSNAASTGAARGTFVLPDLPVGAYTVTFEAPGYATQTHRLQLGAAGRAPMIVSLTSLGGTLGGTVKDSAGHGLTAVGLTLSGPAGRFRTMSISDGQGTFTFVGIPAGQYTLVGELFGHRPASAQVTVTTLNSRIEDSEKELAATRNRLDQQRIETAATASELAEARSRVEALSQRVSDLDRQLVEQVKAMETQAAEGDGKQSGTAAVADAWAAEHAENALLRDRINDIAAEVAKLVMTLEGPDSPIKAILAADPHTRPKQANGSAMAVQATLADRIRALQSHIAPSPRLPG